MKKFAVFDIDGTLIRWQLYHVIVDRLAKEGELGSGAVQKFRSARKKWKNREHHESFSEYEAVLIDLFSASLKSINPAIFDNLVKQVISEYKDQVYTYTRDLTMTLKQQGYTLLAISGSHHELVEEVAKAYGFDDWVGSKYERDNEGFTGMSFIASHNKAEVLEQLISEHGLSKKESYAVGDSASDAPMLEMVEHPIAFNPDRNLYAIAEKSGWNIVIERKNMIYQLEQKNGQYILEKTGK